MKVTISRCSGPRASFEKLKFYLRELGFVYSKADVAFLICVVEGKRIYLLVYVDDIVIMGDDITEVDKLVI